MVIVDQENLIHNIDKNIELKEYEGSVKRESRKDIRVVFMGTPSFAVPILQGLIENYHVVMVVCQPDRKKDRKGNVIFPETKKIAMDFQIEVFQPTNICKDYQKILDTNPDIVITCAYGQMIPDNLIHSPKYGCINVHGSLLPELRGGAPIHWAIIRGFQKTGITIMSMSSKMDAGDIISQASLEIGKDEILDSLYERMSYLGKKLLLDTLPSILDGTCTFQKQDENLVSFGFNITKEEEKIDFSKSAQEIRNLVRGLNSIPGAYCYLDDKRMKVYDVEILNPSYFSKGEIGEIVAVDLDGMICKCQDTYLKIKEIGLEGKKRCLVRDFFNGIDKNSLVGKVIQ